jgi:hypothetical protein
MSNCCSTSYRSRHQRCRSRDGFEQTLEGIAPEQQRMVVVIRRCLTLVYRPTSLDRSRDRYGNSNMNIGRPLGSDRGMSRRKCSG